MANSEISWVVSLKKSRAAALIGIIHLVALHENLQFLLFSACTPLKCLVTYSKPKMTYKRLEIFDKDLKTN